MLVDELLQRDAHLLLDDAGALDVAGDLEQLGAGVVGEPEGGKPRPAPTQALSSPSKAQSFEE